MTTCCRAKLPGQRVQGTATGSIPTIPVDDGVAKHPIEPGHQPLIRWQAFGPIYRPRERILQDVFGHGPVTNMPFEEPEKGPVIFDEHVDGRLRVVASG